MSDSLQVIQVSGGITLVSTKRKPYWYKRKGYWVGDRYVKPKKIRKFKTVGLKKPYLAGDVTIEVNMACEVGHVYSDENKVLYICTSKSVIGLPCSRLRIVSTVLGSAYFFPIKLPCVHKPYSEC